MKRITRRDALRHAALGGGATALGLVLPGCGGETPGGSTLRSTWHDPVGDGQLRRGPGEGLLDRTDLAAATAPVRTLATLAHITDAHALDASSPGRVTFLDRLGAPFQSTFRPQETLTAQVLAGAAAAVWALRPDLVIQGGDLIDNAQANELEHALRALRGGAVSPGSGPRGYYGVQSPWNPDPFYYRPDVDAPRFPGLLQMASRRFASVGVRRPVVPVLGDHDTLVAGEVVPTPLTRSLAIGDRALWELPSGVSVPAGARRRAVSSPDGPPDPGVVDTFLRDALAGPTVRVPPDSGRRQLSFAQAFSALGRAGPRLDYTVDAGRYLRLIVLDLVRRDGGSGGLVTDGQALWLERELRRSGERWVIVVSHQPIARSAGGGQLLAALDRAPRVIAALSGHTHRNRIEPRPSPAGGYWLISTSSLIDYPQQARALRLVATRGGGVALQTWMIDHAFPGRLGAISRQLAYLDAQGGRPGRFAGRHLDRNVMLHR